MAPPDSYNGNRRSVFDLRQKDHYTSSGGAIDCDSRATEETCPDKASEVNLELDSTDKR
jgi:hypothetical protein